MTQHELCVRLCRAQMVARNMARPTKEKANSKEDAPLLVRSPSLDAHNAYLKSVLRFGGLETEGMRDEEK